MGAFIDSLVSNWVADSIAFLVITAFGILTARWRIHQKTWLVPVAWGLGSGIMLLCGYAAARTVVSLAQAKAEATTVSNVKHKIRHWVERLHLAIRSPETPEKSLFAYVLRTEYGREILISQPKAHDRFLVLESLVNVSDEDWKVLAKLSPRQNRDFMSSLTLHLSSRPGGTFTMRGDPVKAVTLHKKILISEALNEVAFVNAVEELDAATYSALMFLNKAIASMSEVSASAKVQ